MAKQLETIDRIQIIAEGPLELVGAGLAALTKLGYQNVGYKLITDELRYKNRTVHEIAATEFAAEFAKANARFKAADLTAHFKAANRTPSAAYYAIKKLMKANIVRENGDDYVRVEALPAPKGKAKPKSRRGGHAQYEVPNKDLIARAIRGRKHITVRELRELFTKEGRPEKSISPILSMMAKAKVVKLVGPGQYDVLPTKPKAVKKKAAAAPAPATTIGNGAAHV